MSEQTNTTIPDITQAKEFISKKLSDSGFMAFEEFSAVDSLIHSDKQIGFYALKDLTANASCLHHESGNIFTQTDCVFEIKLMGTSSDYADFTSFDESCQALYARLLIGSECIVRSAELGRVYQSMPLKRLARELKLTLRLCVNERFQPEAEQPRFHRAVLGGNTVIFPDSLDISGRSRNITINTVDGGSITKPIAPEPARITMSGRFTPDERAFYFKTAEELSGAKDIMLQIDGVKYKDVIPYECSAQIKEGELLGEYHFRLGGRAYEL